MNAPVATERKSFLPLRLRSTTVLESNNITTASRSTTPVTTPMPLAMQNDAQSSLIVGNRVLVNGLKNGILRYIGTVLFAQGLFCGVELEEPDGKHDGQVNDIRYFRCKPNHGIFVPQDKVILASRERSYSIQRPTSRLRPPTMTRSMTISSTTNNKIENIPIKTSPTIIQLPDIIPSSSTPTQPVSIMETINNHAIPTPIEDIKTKIESQPSTIEEIPETIEADFTDSVSLILYQLQQEQKPFSIQSRSSITISEEGTIDDDDDDDEGDDESDHESIAESIISIQPDLPLGVQKNITITQTNLLNSKSISHSTASVNKLKINPIENKANTNKKKANAPTPIPVAKKILERKPAIPLNNTFRRTSLIPSKKELSTKPRTSLGSQSKLNQSVSSSTSINSSYSDLTSNQKKSTSNATRAISHSIDLSSNAKSNPSHHTSDILNHQLMIQQVIIQSLETTNEQLKKQYQHLNHQFDLMCILSQYYINKNDQIKQENELKLSKIRIANNQSKTSIEQLELSHKNELITLNEQHQNEIDTIQNLHQQQLIKCQQEIEKLLNEKIGLETRCISLQEQVDRFLDEMANSEHADPLLRRVETLEKDKGSLQTVLELRNQELTQLRTKINEQVFQREDQIALQKRIDMAENRNQDLVCLLRNWQLNEKVVIVQRDDLKEQLAQLERDKQQLIFENETLLYSLRQRSLTVAYESTLNFNVVSRSIQKLPNRAHSFSSIITKTLVNERPKRSLSLSCVSNR